MGDLQERGLITQGVIDGRSIVDIRGTDVGNAIVPQVAAMFVRAFMEVDAE